MKSNNYILLQTMLFCSLFFIPQFTLDNLYRRHILVTSKYRVYLNRGSPEDTGYGDSLENTKCGAAVTEASGFLSFILL